MLIQSDFISVNELWTQTDIIDKMFGILSTNTGSQQCSFIDPESHYFPILREGLIYFDFPMSECGDIVINLDQLLVPGIVDKSLISGQGHLQNHNVVFYERVRPNHQFVQSPAIVDV